MKTEEEVRDRLNIVLVNNPLPKLGYYSGSVRGVIEAYKWVLDEE